MWITDTVNLITSEGYPYYALRLGRYTSTGPIVQYGLYLLGAGSFTYSGGSRLCCYKKYSKSAGGTYSLSEKVDEIIWSSDRMRSWPTNLPYFETYEEGIAWSDQQIANATKQPSKTALWPSTGLKND